MAVRNTLVIATGNAGKLREFEILLAGLALELRALSDFAAFPEVDETADTYLGNARLKALAAARHTGLPALADDSGLEVDALGGAPGLRSARYAADHGSGKGDADNITLLLRRLEPVADPQRTARFRCVIVVAAADGRELAAEGSCEGVITRQPVGDHGFGYDPVFYHPPSHATFAALSAAQKRAVSHRAAACRQLHSSLPAFLRGANR